MIEKKKKIYQDESMQYIIHQDQVWGNISFLISVEKKRMKDGDKDTKSEDWNLGKF